MPTPWPEVFDTAWRVITFRASHESFARVGNRHLVLGLVCTWLAGMGRNWDHAGAGLAKHLGIGSLIYVFLLAGFLWLLAWPFGPQGFSYRRVLTFVCMTSPCAFLYAIPVERFMTSGNAATANLTFLAVVAIWRVCLLVRYFWRIEGIKGAELLVITLLPLSMIVGPLALGDIFDEILEEMAGLRGQSPIPRMYDGIVFWLGFIAIGAFLPLVGAYIYVWAERSLQANLKKINDADTLA